MEELKRELGYYWVKNYQENGGHWEISYFDGCGWKAMGEEEDFDDDSYDQIGERIPDHE